LTSRDYGESEEGRSRRLYQRKKRGLKKENNVGDVNRTRKGGLNKEAKPDLQENRETIERRKKV